MLKTFCKVMIIPTEEQSNRHDKKGLSEVSWKPKGDAFQIIPTPKSPCMGKNSLRFQRRGRLSELNIRI